MVVGRRTTPVVEGGEVVLAALADLGREPVLVDAALGPALGAGAVVGEEHHHRVVEQPVSLEAVEQAADLVVGVRQEAGEDLLLAGVHPTLLGAQAVPGGHPWRPLRGRVPLGDQPHGALVGDDLVAPGVPALVEGTGVAVRPLGGHVVGGVHGPEGEVGVGGLARSGGRHRQDLAQGPVDEVLGEVVALGLGRVEVDVVVVLDEVRLVLVGVTLEEAVVALEPEAERPAGEGPGVRTLVARDEVPLADGPGGPAGVAQQARRGGGGGVDAAGVPGVVEGDVGDEAHPDVVGVAAGEEGGAGRRAHGGDVEARVPKPLGGQAVDVGRGDGGPEAPEVAEAGVVEHDGQHVGPTLGLGAHEVRAHPLVEPAGVLRRVAHLVPPSEGRWG